jgi:ubiquinone/menaquinone biosynthesis C-methylase UbiE
MEGFKAMSEIFDSWPEKYDQWFETPIGRLVKGYERELILRLLKPERREVILDAGCGTGVFTSDVLEADTKVVGLELSRPMLIRGMVRNGGQSFLPVQGDMRNLPFVEAAFDKALSVTAIEFIEEAKVVVEEMFRVIKPGGIVVVATLNSLSPWAHRRGEAGKKGHAIFSHAIFRSPEEMAALSPVKGVIETAVHFEKSDDPDVAEKIEKEGRDRGLNTGAFVTACWTKPG